MGGASAPAPMDGASNVPPAPADDMGMGEMGPTGPTGDPAGAPMDDPNMGGDPMGTMDNGQLDPQMGGGPDMGGEEPPMDGGEGGDDSTMSIINQLSPEDREAVRSYAESMLSRDEEQNGPDMGGEEPPMGGDPNGGAPMMESFVFTKKQIKAINENLQNMEPEDDDKNKGLEKKKGKNISKKSPFKAPQFK